MTAHIPPTDEELDRWDKILDYAAISPQGTHRLIAEVRRLRAAIRTHRARKADDRCIEDDDRLYEALGDGIKCDRRVGDLEARDANCYRYNRHRCEPGGWPSYVELEAEIARLRAKVTGLENALDIRIGGGRQ